MVTKNFIFNWREK